MLRHTISCALAILTYVVGVSCALLSYKFIPPAASLCELARHPDWYDQTVVRVTGSASAIYGAAVISEARCEADASWANVILDENHKVAPDVEAFLTGEAPEVRKAEVLVVGRFDKNASPGCFGPRFGIRVKTIELKSPITVEPLPKRHD